MKVFVRMVKFKKRKRGGKKRAGWTRPTPSRLGKMDVAAGIEGENNDSTSSTSCFNEFETFAEEVNGEIPEVDYRGRIKSERSSSDEIASSVSQSQFLKVDKTPKFFRSLLSPRTPYEDFHRLFKAVPKDQFPINDFSCALSREILLQGRIYVSQGWFCFYSNIFGWETQVTIDCRKIQSITREKTAYVVPNAILICTDDEKHFFSSFLSRETVYKLLLQVWDEIKENHPENVSSPQPEDEEAPAKGENLENTQEELNDLNDGHPCAVEYEEEETTIYDQQTRRASAGSLGNDRHAETISTQSIETLSRSSKDQPASPESARITNCASVAMLLASIAETVYSYSQVSFCLVQRLTREQLFYLSTSVMIILLMFCSLFLLHRISILEPKILASPAYSPEKIILQQSMYQLWKLRQEVFNAEVVRYKTIVAANLKAITQVRKTLKMLEDDLETHLGRNCTFLEENVCVQI
ncbi:GRAM domain-containing protein 2B-like isoform X3 [Montipora foliosa]|uniref:GRAM domain-containing protein 2B-like isoform X3 n=1 Tax=Montipora foliosa TaxID=591990 RepID=UPI0035F125BA